MSDRRGFTIVELLVVSIIGTLLLMAAYEVLITNRRAYTVQNVRMESQQATRAAMDVLFNELREVSATGGDILDMEDSSLSVRVMRTIGVTCAVDLSLVNPQLTVRKVATYFEPLDSVFVFADNNENRVTDDTWIRALVTSVDTTATCGTEPAQTVGFLGQMPAFVLDSVRPGAPMRAFTRFTYGLMTYGGEVYLGRRENQGDWIPLVGPLRDAATGASGIEFEYLDEAGNDTTDPMAVRQINVTVRTWSDVVDESGHRVLDTLAAHIYTRN